MKFQFDSKLQFHLGPIKAFQMRLVKKISVASVVAENDANAAFIKANAITNKDGRITANLSFHKQTPEGPKIIKATFRQDDDLFLKKCDICLKSCKARSTNQVESKG